MTGDRFEADLRQVLLADAPGSVPEELRRRIAAVPLAALEPAMPLSRVGWLPMVPVGALVLTVLVVVLSIFLLRAGQDPGPGGVDPILTPTPSPSASPTPTRLPTPSPSRPSTASPTPSSTVGPCRAADLDGRITGVEGAAGSRLIELEITNMSSSTCLVQGTPVVQLVDATGRVLLNSTAEPSVAPDDPTFEVPADGRLVTSVAASNYCGPSPVSPLEVAFTLPAGGGRLVALPDAGGTALDLIPPCLGSDEGTIAMNGWRDPTN